MTYSTIAWPLSRFMIRRINRITFTETQLPRTTECGGHVCLNARKQQFLSVANDRKLNRYNRQTEKDFIRYQNRLM